MVFKKKEKGKEKKKPHLIYFFVMSLPFLFQINTTMLSELIVYCKSIRFPDWAGAEKLDCSYMFSLNETDALRKSRTSFKGMDEACLLSGFLSTQVTT